jgi:putative aldouronate transport system permease protein
MRRKRSGFKSINMQYNLLALPAIILFLIFAYVPMAGLVLAFKDYRFDLGVFKSPWVGFQNFKFFFTSEDAWRITSNTLELNFLFIGAGLVFSVIFALMLFEIKNKYMVKFYQTSMILPNFISWVVVGYMSYIILNPTMGVMNSILKIFGAAPIDWYAEPGYWPGILLIAYLWKSVGINSVIYFAALMGIDTEYYEAADLDGATKLQKIIHISIPFIMPTILIMFILALGGIFRSDFGLFYQLTRDIGKLYSTTDVIDTYIMRSLKTLGDVGMSSAVGLFQSVVGFVTVIVANWVVKKIDSDSAIM